MYPSGVYLREINILEGHLNVIFAISFQRALIGLHTAAHIHYDENRVVRQYPFFCCTLKTVFRLHTKIRFSFLFFVKKTLILSA